MTGGISEAGDGRMAGGRRERGGMGSVGQREGGWW